MTNGTAPDGTPVADLIEELRELKATLAQYKSNMRTIYNYVNAPYWEHSRKAKIAALTLIKGRDR